MTGPSSFAHIFVSHSHVDNNFGIQLTQDLCRALGNDKAAWYDAHGGLYGGDSWWDVIVQELVARPFLVLIVSPDAMQASWVRREYTLALKEKKRIIPLHYRKSDLWPDLELLQVISFLPPKTYTASFNDLMAAIRSQMPSMPTPPPPVAKAGLQRLEREHESLRELYDYQAEKVKRRRKEYLAQAPGPLRDQLTSDLERENNELQELEKQIEDIEREIENRHK
jgi:TIR domain